LRDVVVWDSEALESKRDDVGWDEYRHRAGVSVACVIEAATGLPTFFTAGDRAGYDLDALAERLEAADEVVSYNGIHWDTPVLSETIMRPVLVHECDLYAHIRTALHGQRWPQGSWKLGRVALDTIGVGKNGDGGVAPTLWREKQVGRLITYCYVDTWITWKLWEFIRRHGFVLDPDGGHLEVNLYGT